MVVIDASVLGPALLGHNADGKQARDRIRRERAILCPQLVDLEILSIFRRWQRTEKLPDRRLVQAIQDLADLPLDRVPHPPLRNRVWELRHNITPYDAAYVATAELYELPLLTADTRLANAPGTRCEFEIM